MDSIRNMYVNGEYLKHSPTWGEQDSLWKANLIFNMIQKNGIQPDAIIEVGCGAGGILKELSLKPPTATSYTGYDISPQAIAIAKKKENGLVSFHEQDFLLLQDNADLLLVIDVVEHVDDFYDFLRRLKSRSQHFIFHIPLDLCCRSLLKPHILLQQRESVGHIHYFSKEMVKWFLKDTGYVVIDWHFTKPDIDRAAPDSMKKALKKLARSFSFTINKQLSATLWGGYSMLILAK